MFEKVTPERKEQVKLRICNFIDQLEEDDTLSIGGKEETDIITGKGKKTMYVMADKQVD